MIDTIGCGRYGEVKKARYKGDQIVAVKVRVTYYIALSKGRNFS